MRLSEHLRTLPDMEGLTAGSTGDFCFNLKDFNGKRNVTSSRVADEEGGNRRQELIVVASLLDKAPNLAGLSRTCEVLYKCHIIDVLRITHVAYMAPIIQHTEGMKECFSSIFA